MTRKQAHATYIPTIPSPFIIANFGARTILTFHPEPPPLFFYPFALLPRLILVPRVLHGPHLQDSCPNTQRLGCLSVRQDGPPPTHFNTMIALQNSNRTSWPHPPTPLHETNSSCLHAMQLDQVGIQMFALHVDVAQGIILDEAHLRALGTQQLAPIALADFEVYTCNHRKLRLFGLVQQLRQPWVQSVRTWTPQLCRDDWCRSTKPGLDRQPCTPTWSHHPTHLKFYTQTATVPLVLSHSL